MKSTYRTLAILPRSALWVGTLLFLMSVAAVVALISNK